tara:strand:+ start:53613 stop:54275 length:663 start_codon:yes stop_codon:yes gene_type:complete
MLEREYGTDCTILSADLSVPGAAQALFQVSQECDLEIDFLINNAGLLFNGYFTELDLAGQEQLMMLNMVTLSSLCHLFANDMETRRGGHILNVASTAAWMPLPTQNVYAASKSYVLSFTLALADELRASGSPVSVCALCPGYTATRMLDNPDQGGRLKVPAVLIQSAERVARKGISACLAGKPSYIPDPGNRMIAGLSQLLPKRWMTALMGRTYRRMMEN